MLELKAQPSIQDVGVCIPKTSRMGGRFTNIVYSTLGGIVRILKSLLDGAEDGGACALLSPDVSRGTVCLRSYGNLRRHQARSNILCPFPGSPIRPSASLKDLLRIHVHVICPHCKPLKSRSHRHRSICPPES